MSDCESSTAHHGAPRRAAAIVVLALALLLAACGSGAADHVQLYATPTPGPQAQFLAYVGGDGNLWRLTLPDGIAIQLTTDAHPATVTYSHPAWSPDGKLLAVLRVTHSGNTATSELTVLRPNGQVTLQVPLLDIPYNHAFAWSPNSRYIAYRILTTHPASGQALLVILDARSGALHKALRYPFRQGCSGSPTALRAGIYQIHAAVGGVDTFTWTPDGRAVLASSGCSNDSSLLIDVSRGSVVSGYPRGASFQPGGSLMLGSWSAEDNAPVLGLRDATNTTARALATGALSASSRYPILIGQAAWSADGRRIYYERTDGIWRVNSDGSGAREIVPGTALDSHHAATVELAPALSPNGQMLLYCELQGMDTSSGSVRRAWYLAAPDGSNPAVLPDVTTDAVWQPLA